MDSNSSESTVPVEVIDSITNNGGIGYKAYSYFKNNSHMMTPEITQLMVDNLKPGKYVEASTLPELTPYLTISNMHAIGEHIITTDVSNEAYGFLNNLDNNYDNAISDMRVELLRQLVDNDIRSIDFSSKTVHLEIISWFNIDGMGKYVLEYLIMHDYIDRFVNAINNDYRMSNGTFNVQLIFKRLDNDPLTVNELLDHYNISKDTQLGVLI